MHGYRCRYFNCFLARGRGEESVDASTSLRWDSLYDFFDCVSTDMSPTKKTRMSETMDNVSSVLSGNHSFFVILFEFLNGQGCINSITGIM